MEKPDEKPITDKDNFPTEKVETIVLNPMLQMAYSDGCADGYRKAITDLIVWSIVGFIVTSIIARLYATN
jgi:hypothetical protein